jgi:hypothetical protein
LDSPLDSKKQHAVLAAALDLLQNPELNPPVIVDFSRQNHSEER